MKHSVGAICWHLAREGWGGRRTVGFWAFGFFGVLGVGKLEANGYGGYEISA